MKSPLLSLFLLAASLLPAAAQISADVQERSDTASAEDAPEVTVAPLTPAEPAPELKRSVVRINSTQQSWGAAQPWDKNSPTRRRALGPIVAGNRVLTTSEIVADATYLEFESTDGTRVLPAKVVAVDYEANLALLGPADDAKAASFFRGTRPLQIAKSPELGDTLDILQVEQNGMPLVTPGILQGVDLVSTFLPGELFLSYEVKASMQSAASSFSVPVLSKGRLTGILSSYNSKDQLSDVIATEIVSRFLKSAADGTYTGFPKLGIGVAGTGDPSFRAWLKIPDDEGGIYVSKVRQGSAADLSGIKEGDVILSVGGHSIDRRGYYEHPTYGSLFWSHLVRGEKNIGDVVKMKLLREGKPLDLDVKLADTNAQSRLVPPYTFGQAPKYLLKGGLVFQELTLPLLQSFGSDWRSAAPLNLIDTVENPEKYEDKFDRIVFLSGVIATPATLGYESLRNLIVVKVNDQPVRDMKSLVEAFQSNKDGLHSIQFDEEDFTIYLDEETSAAVDAQLMQRGIPNLSRVE